MSKILAQRCKDPLELHVADGTGHNYHRLTTWCDLTLASLCNCTLPLAVPNVFCCSVAQNSCVFHSIMEAMRASDKGGTAWCFWQTGLERSHGATATWAWSAFRCFTGTNAFVCHWTLPTLQAASAFSLGGQLWEVHRVHLLDCYLLSSNMPSSSSSGG